MKQLRAVIFVDYWNLQLNWNRRFQVRGQGLRLDWHKVSPVIGQEAETILRMSTGEGISVAVVETRIYASVNRQDPSEVRMENWLRSRIARIQGHHVQVRSRRLQTRVCRCRACAHEFSVCPSCGQEMQHASEKGVDASVVTDMLALGLDGAYDIAILVSQDADYLPVVERLRDRGIKTLNAGWSDGGRELAAVCWGHIALDIQMDKLARTAEAPEPRPQDALNQEAPIQGAVPVDSRVGSGGAL